MNRQVKPNGFVLLGVLLASIMLVILTTALVFWVQQESKISVKHRKSSTAFNLAEAAVDQGRWKLQEKSDNWTLLSSGTITGYDFDRTYEGTGGIYAIRISSDPSDDDRRIIEGVGRDSSTDEVRRIKAIFEATTPEVDFSIQAEKTVGVGASCNVYWGQVMAQGNITTGGRLHPRFYSGEHITDRDGGSTSPQTDGVQWWSYFDLPPTPTPDIEKDGYYFNISSAAGASPCASVTNYYTDGDIEFQNCTDLTGNTYYATGKVTFKSGGKDGNFILGNVIALGDIEFSGNGGSGNPNGSYYADVPPNAWKEYGNAWGVYQGFDGGAPATYAEAAASPEYTATGVTYKIEDILIHGFLYTGGSQGLNGGGNGRFHGVLMSANDATLTTSNFSIYYDDNVAQNVRLLPADVIITRVSWYEVAHEWPSGL